MDEELKRFNRPSIRLENYNYSSPGAYFVSVVAYKLACLFGEIVDGEMRLSLFGNEIITNISSEISEN